MKIFEKKTVLITGGTSEIGKVAALAFAQQGASVVVSGRRIPEGEEVAAQITALGDAACSSEEMLPRRKTSSRSSIKL